VVEHVAAHQQVHRRAGPQPGKIAEAGEVQVAAAAMARDRVLAAVEAEVGDVGAQRAQRGAPCTLAAADVEHRTQRSLEVVLGRRHRQRDLALEAPAPADAALAVPAVEVGTVVVFLHARTIADAARCLTPHAPSATHAMLSPSHGVESMEAYFWVKTLHLVFVVAWMAAGFYLPRILLNVVEAGDVPAVRERLELMGRRLYLFG